MGKKPPTTQTTEPVADRLRPGDVWRHPGSGRFYVTDDLTEEEVKKWPGHLKCYWSMGGNPNAPCGMFLPDAPIVKNMTLVSRMSTEE